jgi:hypothetical protein
MYLQLHANLFLSDTSVLRTTLRIIKKLEQLFSSAALVKPKRNPFAFAKTEGAASCWNYWD